MTADSNEALLEKKLEDEEKDDIVLSIRDELMDRVMNECYKSYLKKQTVRFVVQCAYDAIVKFLSFNFYYHPDVPDITQSIWIPDQPIKPSPKDTWASDAVPIRPVNYQPEEEDELVYETESESTNTKATSTKRSSSEDSKYCLCMEHVCTCLVPAEDICKKLDEMSEKPCPSKVKFSPKSSKSVIEKPSVPEGSAEYYLGRSYSEVSDPFSEKETTEDVTTTEGYDSNVKLDLDRSRIAKKKAKPQPPVKEVKSIVIDNFRSGSQASAVGLPPIRVNSKFYSKPVEKQKKTF